MKYLAIPSPDGLRLEEVNPYSKNYELTSWQFFDRYQKKSFLTDDPRVVVGQQYDADEYELIKQAQCKYFGDWQDFDPDAILPIEYVTRQILRRKAEGEKDRQRRGINDIFEAEAGDDLSLRSKIRYIIATSIYRNPDVTVEDGFHGYDTATDKIMKLLNS